VIVDFCTCALQTCDMQPPVQVQPPVQEQLVFFPLLTLRVVTWGE